VHCPVCYAATHQNRHVYQEDAPAGSTTSDTLTGRLDGRFADTRHIFLCLIEAVAIMCTFLIRDTQRNGSTEAQANEPLRCRGRRRTHRTLELHDNFAPLAKRPDDAPRDACSNCLPTICIRWASRRLRCAVGKQLQPHSQAQNALWVLQVAIEEVSYQAAGSVLEKALYATYPFFASVYPDLSSDGCEPLASSIQVRRCRHLRR
jgi:hypothetical protein